MIAYPRGGCFGCAMRLPLLAAAISALAALCGPVVGQETPPTTAEAARAIRASLGAVEVHDLSCGPRHSGYVQLCSFSRGDGRPTWTAVFVREGGAWRLHHEPWPTGIAYLPIDLDGYFPGDVVSVERCLTRGVLNTYGGRALCSVGLSLPVGPRPPEAPVP